MESSLLDRAGRRFGDGLAALKQTAIACGTRAVRDSAR
jgi:hypothetical protein